MLGVYRLQSVTDSSKTYWIVKISALCSLKNASAHFLIIRISILLFAEWDESRILNSLSIRNMRVAVTVYFKNMAAIELSLELSGGI